MMSVLEYAMDVSKSTEEIFKLCDKLEIQVENEDSMLSEDDIILLDNEIQDSEDYIVSEEEEEERKEDELIETVDRIVEEAAIDIDKTITKKQKVKKKTVSKKNDEFLKQKKEIYKHREKLQSNTENTSVVVYKDGMTVRDLSEIMKINPAELIKKLISLGVMANLNFALDFDVCEILVADYNKVLKREEQTDINDFENFEMLDDEKDLLPRPPVVTIMGHVDHGKTSLLDAIRKTNVVESEAGGITQAIGAYQVKCDDDLITFIDTPGHEAFTEMRARGASVTDIVIVIVAADDGVMPQTKEAIDHAKAAGVPIIVAVNKMDKPDANPDKVLTELSEYGLTPEQWGGDVIVNKISAKTHEGIKELLESVLLVASMQELKANPNRYASGAVLEARMDKHKGCIASILIQNGTLRLGDPIVAGTCYGKIRTLKNDKGMDVAYALPSTPVEITGLNDLPTAGDKFMAFQSEKEARSISEERKERAREKDTNRSGLTLEDLFSKIKEGIKEINVVLKADVKGSEEAVKNSLNKIDVEGVKINIIRSGVGGITESDVVLANASNAIIIGFNVRPSNKTTELAKEYGVDIRLHDIIYKVVEEMEDAMKGMLDPEYEEKITGHAEIRKLFKFSKVGNIAGCHVTDGEINNNSKARVIRDGVVIYTGSIKSVQREKDQVKTVKKDMDCGLTLENFQDLKENDVIETFELVEIKR